MVLRLADALNVPLRQHNALLLAAGFAPAWPETELGAPELAQISSAVDYMLAAAGAVSGRCSRPALEFAEGQQGSRALRRIPGGAVGGRCRCRH